MFIVFTILSSTTLADAVRIRGIGEFSAGAATGGRRGPRLAESGAGRKPRLSAEDLQKIERGLKHGPEGLGYETGLWTAWRVAHLIEEECGVGYYASQVWALLRPLGWSRPV